MQCPSCGFDASAKDFGSPPVCPECDAIYEKALVARAKRNEMAGKLEQASQKPPPEESMLMKWLKQVRFPRFRAPAKPLHLVLWLFLAAFIVHLATQESKPPSAKQLEADRLWRLEMLAKNKISARLKDAESARWGEIFEGKAGPVCGSVNAKNGFGAYAGYTRFVVSGGDAVFFESDVEPMQFGEVWSSMCR